MTRGCVKSGMRIFSFFAKFSFFHHNSCFQNVTDSSDPFRSGGVGGVSAFLIENDSHPWSNAKMIAVLCLLFDLSPMNKEFLAIRRAISLNEAFVLFS